MNIRILIVAALSLVPFAMLVGSTSAYAGPVEGSRPSGVLWALVLHSQTGNGLEGMPVYVSTVKPRESEKPIRALTGKDGMAQVTGLAPGEYIAWVSFNNHVSEIAAFTIDNSLLAKVAIEFNPDID